MKSEDIERLSYHGARVKATVADVEVFALISTGSRASAIDTAFAESLGIVVKRQGLDRKPTGGMVYNIETGCHVDLRIPSIDHRIEELPVVADNIQRGVGDELCKPILGPDALVGLKFTYDGRAGTFCLTK